MVKFQKYLSGSGRMVLENLLIISFYWGVAHLNFMLFRRGGVLPIPLWPSAAVGLSGALIYGWRVTPGIAAGSLLANAVSLGSGWLLAAAVAITNTLGPALTAHIIRHKATSIPPFDSLKNVVLFLAFGVILMAAITATGEVGGKWLFGQFSMDALASSWGRWWTAHAMGAMLFTPVILGWFYQRNVVRWSKIGILGLFLLLIFALSYAFLTCSIRHSLSLLGLSSLFIIPLMWMSISYTLRETMSVFALFVVSVLVGILFNPSTYFMGEVFLISFGLLVTSFCLAILVINGVRGEWEAAVVLLREKKDELDWYFSSALDLLCIADMAGNFRKLNPEWERILGYPVSELEGKPFISFVHPDDVAATLAVVEDLKTERLVLNFVNRYRCSDGSYRWLEWRSYREKDKLFAVARDITDRRNTEKELAQSEEKFRTFYENITEGVALHELVYDTFNNPTDYRILDVNPAYPRHTGLGRDAARGRLATELYGTPDPPYLKEFVNVALTGEPFRFETYFPPMDKHFLISVIRPKHGQFATVFEDITERKKNEIELKKKNEELARFIYTVSHDLKSPLVTIKSFTSFLVEDIKKADTDAQERDIAYIQNAVDKMGHLLEELLELSRIGRKETMKKEVDAQQVINEALDLVAGRVSQRQIEVRVNCQGIRLWGDEQRFVQLYQNLIDNAAKFMGEQSHPLIEIGYKESPNGIMMFVSDNGAGIDPRYKHKLFGLFEKLDTASEGTGIGLALAKRIVEVHGGHIWFESDGVGKGTCFYFTLDNIQKG